MELTQHHDPWVKSKILAALNEYLFLPLYTDFDKRIEHLILKNTKLQGLSHMSFVYKGELYNKDPSRVPRKANRLDPSLYPEMEEYLEEYKAFIYHEQPRIDGFISQVLNATDELHDYLKVLPSSVHQPIMAIIASCPCTAQGLSQERVEALIRNNQVPIALIKERLARNLIL